MIFAQNLLFLQSNLLIFTPQFAVFERQVKASLPSSIFHKNTLNITRFYNYVHFFKKLKIRGA